VDNRGLTKKTGKEDSANGNAVEGKERARKEKAGIRNSQERREKNGWKQGSGWGAKADLSSNASPWEVKDQKRVKKR